MPILVFVYMILGYWATGKTIYANKIVFHAFGELFMQRMVYGAVLGWFLIPWALLKMLFSRR